MSTTSDFNAIRILTQSEFENNFSSTSNDTLYFVEMDNTLFDGQWVQSFVTLMESNGTKNAVQVSLSSYLPSDNYKYNVKFKLQGYDDDSTYFYRIETDIFDDGFTATGSSIGTQLNGGTYSRQNVNVFDLPVGAGRYIKVYGSGGDTINIYALGYRRIGTNI